MELKGHTIGFKGEYSATVLRADGTVKEFLNEEKTLRSGDVIKNLLLDNFFTRLISVVEPIALSPSIRCGTGSAPVQVSQNSLSSQLSLTSGSWPTNNGPRGTAFIEDGKLKASNTYTFTFSLGQIVGNISELGINLIGTNTASNTLIHSRALVVDNQNNPTTISVTSAEQLIITYTLRMETSAADVVASVDMLINGVVTPVEVTSRWGAFGTLNDYTASSFGSMSGWFVGNGSLGPVGGNVLGVTTTINNPTFNYLEGSKTGTISIGINSGNLTGGISVLTNNSRIIKFGFNPPIPKNPDRTMSITYRQTFGRLP